MAPTIAALLRVVLDLHRGDCRCAGKAEFPVTNDHDRLNRIQRLTSEAVLRVLHDELALLILLLAILHPRTSLQIAESQLRVHFPKVSQRGIDDSAQQRHRAVSCDDPSHQSQALVKVASEIRATYGLNLQQNDEMLQIVAAHFDVQVHNESEDEQTVVIRFGDTSQSTALAVVSRLSEYFSSTFPQRGVIVTPAIDDQIVDLKRRIGALQQSRQEFVENRVNQLKDRYKTQVAEQSVPIDVESSIDPTPESEPADLKENSHLAIQPTNPILSHGQVVVPSGDVLACRGLSACRWSPPT